MEIKRMSGGEEADHQINKNRVWAVQEPLLQHKTYVSDTKEKTRSSRVGLRWACAGKCRTSPCRCSI